MTQSVLHQSTLQVKSAVRIVARNILGPRLTALVRRPSFAKYRSELRLRRGLEIGGPSELMKDEGPIPIYDVLRSLDNCLYSGSTIWTGEVREEDQTHVPEVLELHDLSRDEGAGTKEQFRQRCLANHMHRALHHHVFDTLTALATVNCAGLQILRVDNLKPFHIIILASRTNRA